VSGSTSWTAAGVYCAQRPVTNFLNFGNGQINAYDPTTGEFVDKVRNPHGQAIVIDGQWSLKVGNGGNGGLANTIYFTAGPNDEKDGLFGSLSPQ
jgi:uncharacterized protein (TIGR03118 family)